VQFVFYIRVRANGAIRGFSSVREGAVSAIRG
jgi:hypothetical protein